VKNNILIIFMVFCTFFANQIGYSKTARRLAGSTARFSRVLEHGNLNAVKAIVPYGLDINNNQVVIKNASGFTPLQAAIYYWKQGKNQENHAEIIRYLINNGADVNVKLKDMQQSRLFGLPIDSTLLHVIVQKIALSYRGRVSEAVLKKETDLLVFFVLNRANLSDRNKDGRRPVDYIVGNNRAFFLKRLLEGGIGSDVIYNEIIRIHNIPLGKANFEKELAVLLQENDEKRKLSQIQDVKSRIVKIEGQKALLERERVNFRKKLDALKK